MTWEELKLEMNSNESPEMAQAIHKHNDLVEKGKETFSKRRHKAQGSAPTQRVNLSLANVPKADAQAAKMGLSRSAYIDWLIEKANENE